MLALLLSSWLLLLLLLVLPEGKSFSQTTECFVRTAPILPPIIETIEEAVLMFVCWPSRADPDRQKYSADGCRAMYSAAAAAAATLWLPPKIAALKTLSLACLLGLCLELAI